MATFDPQAPIDWRSVFLRYVGAVMADDVTVGTRCLTDPVWCPPWAPGESKAVAEILQEAWAARAR